MKIDHYNLFDSKKLIRNHFRKLRNQLLPQEIKEKSNLIFENFVKLFYSNYLQNHHHKIFSLYLPINNEVETNKIAELFHNNNIIFSYPKIIAENAPLEFVKSSYNNNFINSQFYQNLLEINNSYKITPEILIIPLLAFDKSLSRLGMGGGFFDRTIDYLRSQNSQLATIGLAYDFQEFEGDIPTNYRDQKLDMIITNNRVFR
ncbi:MAG: 5-formyltetrahydrofolate cyclo-ligase [Rickettsiales bacterium]|jgi:5-formyltetrahydrofolate cyclo-ligase|nr:5-formyltetrahydrofolate cyclo-ligase [Rickettsiales bacterium]